MPFSSARPTGAGRSRARAGALVLAALALVASSCGGNDCSGVLTFNVNASECESLAQQFGCTGFNVEGPSCGLFGCASCGDLNPNQDDQGAS